MAKSTDKQATGFFQLPVTWGVIGAVGGIGLTLVGGYFLVVKPIKKLMVDQAAALAVYEKNFGKLEKVEETKETTPPATEGK